MRTLLALMGLLAGTLAAASAAAETPPDYDYLARLMSAAMAARQPYPDIARVNPALDDAALFEVQRRFVAAQLAAGAEIGGFKGGFLPAAPVGGVLFRETFLSAPARIDAGEYVGLLVEAELGFEFCKSVRAPLADVAALKAVVCRLRGAVELPDAAIHDLATLKSDLPRLRRALIPNNVATRRVLLSPPRPAAGIDVAQLPVTTRGDGVVLGTRDLATPADLWANVLWVVNEYALKRGYPIDAGFIVIPGNLTGIHAGKPGHYEVDYGPLGRVTFDVFESSDAQSKR